MLALVLPDEVLEQLLILGVLLVTLSVLISWLQAVLVLDEEEQTEEVERRLEDHLPVAVVHPDLEISTFVFKNLSCLGSRFLPNQYSCALLA